MARALVEAVQAQWTNRDEMMAQLLERVDVLLRVTIQANSSKRVNFGPQFHYPRPGEDERKAKRSVRPGEFARRLMAAGRGG